MLKTKPLVGIVPFGISKDCSAHTVQLIAHKSATADCQTVLIADRDATVRGQIAAGQVVSLQSISSLDEARKSDTPTQLAIKPVVRRNTLTGLEDTDLAATVVAALEHGLRLARDGGLDALLILGDPARPGDRLAVMPDGLLTWIAQRWAAPSPKEPPGPIPTLADIHAQDGFWHLSVLEPMPLIDVPNALSPQILEQAAELLCDTLAKAGFDNPNLAIAGLNPRHLGGRFHGTDEVNLMAELVERQQRAGRRLFGPWPMDEILCDIRDGALDGVITLHAEQARILNAFTGMQRAPQIVAGLGVPCVRAVWERQPGKPIDKQAELDEAVNALNTAKLLAGGNAPKFRFRGENRLGTSSPRK